MSSEPIEVPPAAATMTTSSGEAAAAPSTDPSLRSCFICLQNAGETPNTVWVNACPCTLEAHEDCMLRWIAEHERESTKPLRCPACKGKIKTVEPRDRFIGIRDHLHKMYSRMTPAILLGILTGCSMAGSSYYGMLSICVFAGPGPAMGWLGLGKALADRRLNPGVPWYRWRAGWDFCFRFWLLHFIAPALLIQKALPPQLIDFMTVPASVFVSPFLLGYGVSLVLRDDMPQWPPSPAWVMTVLPWVSFSYNRIYHDLFGAYERRLNQALRGRSLPNEELPAAEGGRQQVDVAPDNGGDGGGAAAAAAAAAEAEDEGYFAQALRVGNAVLNMIGDDNNDEEVVAEIELHIGPGEDEQAAIQELQEELNEIAGGDGDGLVVIQEEPAAEAEQQDQQPVREANGGDENDAADPPPPIRLEPRAGNDQQAANNNNDGHGAPAADNNNNRNNNNNNDNQAPEEPIREARGTSTTLTDLVNGVVSALTFPLVCWGAGVVLNYTLPSPWVTRTYTRPATGLLQEQWGRSLVGGALYIVARDMVNLYTKHRRVQVRKHRRVRNVPRRKPRQVSRQGSSAE
ncbi:hypothetical protein M406DRAFT_337917 [Cryphonectria parasitica EP155]|uniref:RING-type domain-containing protein n=1 Tax=Cryphonectria parasitica (strain ATCC 38755 / EP155) TaxID=660469 RepID=A0A9P4Y5G9_CRYP1|nr:uncharacterized protein M406DRAFT_337917 [Cryphonectria parasitica EP155]KAF3767041.1 hypothetical protein M406DRAFT_337917 [Cryphonectria parasitica EP155]